MAHTVIYLLHDCLQEQSNTDVVPFHRRVCTKDANAIQKCHGCPSHEARTDQDGEDLEWCEISWLRFEFNLFKHLVRPFTTYKRWQHIVSYFNALLGYVAPAFRLCSSQSRVSSSPPLVIVNNPLFALAH